MNTISDEEFDVLRAIRAFGGSLTWAQVNRVFGRLNSERHMNAAVRHGWAAHTPDDRACVLTPAGEALLASKTASTA